MIDLPTGTVTFLFTDIEGSSRLWQEHPELMQDALERHDGLIREAIERYGGHVVKMRGDGAHAVFASAIDAVRAAIAGQKVMANEPWAESLGPLKVRMGLHIGHAQAREGDYFGPVVNQAARIQDAGHGGQILLSQALRGVVQAHMPADVEIRDLGEHLIRDFPQPEHIYQLSISEQVQPFPPLRTLSKRRSNLPTQPTRFIGREKELAELTTLLANPNKRLMTIVAPGGMGKTRLSLAAAEQQLGSEHFPDGIFFVALAPLSDSNHIPSVVAEALDLPLEAGGQQRRTPRQQVLDYLQKKQLLLIMDNFEHLMAGVNLVVDILAAAPHVQILVTTRERLRLQEEHLFAIQGLEFPGWETIEDAAEYTAVQLFLQSARRVELDFKLDAGNLMYLTNVCRLVEGMPLAIELAASWVDMLSLADIAEEIQQSLDFLETEARNVPARQRSIRAVFAYSWERLSMAEQALFIQLSIFRGGFTRKAAQAITGASLRSLSSLANKSFLQYNRIQNRYQIHELLRQYAAEKLSEDAVLERDAEERHSVYYCQLLAQKEVALKGAVQQEALAEIEADIENIRGGWNWAIAGAQFERLAPSLFALGIFHERQGRFEGGAELFSGLSTALSSIESDPARILLSQALIWLSVFQNALGETDVAITMATRALGMTKMPEVRALGLLRRGQFSLGRDNEAAKIDLAASLKQFRVNNNQWHSTQAQQGLGEVLWYLGEFDAARLELEACLVIRRTLSDWHGLAQVTRLLSSLARYSGQGEDALKYAEECLDICQRLGNRLATAVALGNLAVTLGFYYGRFSCARELQSEAMSIFEELNALPQQSDGHHRQAVYSMCLGDLERMTGHLQRGAAIARAIGHHQYLAQSLFIKGAWLLGTPEQTKGQQILWECCLLYRQASVLDELLQALAFLAYSKKRVIGEDRLQALLLSILSICLKREFFIRLAETNVIISLLLVEQTGNAPNLTESQAKILALELIEVKNQWPIMQALLDYLPILQPVRALLRSLSPALIAEAKDRGSKRNVWQIAEMLLEELPKVGWPALEPFDIDEAFALLADSRADT